MSARKIGFQGAKGANSEIAIRDIYQGWEAVACDTFEDVFNALKKGEIELIRSRPFVDKKSTTTLIHA